MGLTIKSTKGLSERPLVVKVIKEIEKIPSLFRYIARLFSDYKSNDPTLLSEIHNQIKNYLSNPRLNLNDQASERIQNLLIEIYNQKANEYGKIRTEILENSIYLFGPFKSPLTPDDSYIEPIILDKELGEEDKVVGESNIKCDFVYYREDNEPMEFIECKTNIENVIPRTLPYEEISSTHKKKLEYLDAAYKYLSKKYKSPYIFFACYNLNYERSLENLQANWGFGNMGFLNAEQIFRGSTI